MWPRLKNCISAWVIEENPCLTKNLLRDINWEPSWVNSFLLNVWLLCCLSFETVATSLEEEDNNGWMACGSRWLFWDDQVNFPLKEALLFRPLGCHWGPPRCLQPWTWGSSSHKSKAVWDSSDTAFLAVKENVKKLWRFWWGRQFAVITDHEPLMEFFKKTQDYRHASPRWWGCSPEKRWKSCSKKLDRLERCIMGTLRLSRGWRMCCGSQNIMIWEVGFRRVHAHFQEMGCVEKERDIMLSIWVVILCMLCLWISIAFLGRITWLSWTSALIRYGSIKFTGNLVEFFARHKKFAQNCRISHGAPQR